MNNAQDNWLLRFAKEVVHNLEHPFIHTNPISEILKENWLTPSQQARKIYKELDRRLGL